MNRAKKSLAMFMAVILLLFNMPGINTFASDSAGTAKSAIVVYADGTKENSGDGKTADTAVKTLQEAYKMLDAAAGGTIVISGDTEVSGDLNLEDLNVTGKVTLTSVAGNEDYSESASLVLKGGLQLALTDSTVMDKMNIKTVATSKGSQLVYSGLSLDIKDTVTCSGNGTLKIFCGRMQDTTDKTINVSLNGGTYNQIFMGSHTKYDTGNVNLTVGENTSITSNVTFGANTKKSGDLNFTMNGGYVKVLYDTPSKNGQTGNVTANLNAGTITEMRDYNGASGMQMKDITINVNDAAFNYGSAQFGVWSNGAVSTGNKKLNIYNYQGSNINSLENYDVVNVFGADVPDKFVSSEDKGSLNIYDYNGLLGLNLNPFNKITSTNSNVTFSGEVPKTTADNNKLKLVVNDGSVLRIRSSKNPGVTKEDYAVEENGTGKVVLEEPAYEGQKEVLNVNFNKKTAADVSGLNNNGTICGNPDFVESYDGSDAIYIKNAFGENNASQYVTFKDLKGIDITKDDFTISFWYHTVNGGNTEWAKATQATTSGVVIDMDKEPGGGIIYSNQDTVKDTAGISAAQFAQTEFFTTGITDKNGTHYDKDGIRKLVDDRWHLATITYDRDSFYKVYADDTLAATVDISGINNQQLGINTLVLGADVNGHYGLENAYIDDLKIYSEVMSHEDVQANFYVDRLNGLIKSAQNHVEELGSEYYSYKPAITAEINKAKEAAKDISAKNYDKAIAAYQELNNAYETFLSAPQKDAKLSSLLLSDIHITKKGDSNAKKLESIFKDITDNNIKVDTMINTGDFADNSQAATTTAAYDVFLELSDKYNLNDMMMIASYGNHEIQYTDESANYKVSTPLYWKYIMDYLNEYVNKGVAKIDYINHDDEYNSNSYSVTYKGYHFLVLNGDYMEQTGDSSTYKDENGNYSIEGNTYDPIRHGAHFYESTKDWMKKVLDNYSKDGLPIFVLNHFPFIDSVPLSYYDEIVINDNSIGKQDPEIRRILGNYDNIYYFCGHLHESFGMNKPVEVVSDNGGKFTEINLPAIKSAARAYSNLPSNWIMYVYDDEIVLRARDYTTGEWLPQYDEVLKLKKDTQGSEDNKGEETKPGEDNKGEETKPEDDNKGGQTDIDNTDKLISEKVAEIENAAKGAVVKVEMKDTTVVSDRILKAAKGKDVNLVLDMGGYSWTINGNDITGDDFKDINLEVKFDTNAIPESLINETAGTKTSKKISLTYDGELGFTAKLVFNAGSEYKGRNAELYYYNEKTGKLESNQKGKVSEDGNIELSFSHASDYLLVFEDNSETENGNKTENTGDEEKGGQTENTGDEEKGGQTENTGDEEKGGRVINQGSDNQAGQTALNDSANADKTTQNEKTSDTVKKTTAKSASSVQTGDNSAVVLISILMILSALSAGLVVVRKKKDCNN